MKKSVLIFLVVLSMCCCFSISQVKAETKSGTCGDGVNWTLDEENILTVSGNGKVESAPWIEVADSVIDSDTGLKCYKIDKIIIKDKVILDPYVMGFEYMGFSFTTATSIRVDGLVENIPSGFANYNPYLKEVFLGRGIERIGSSAFANNKSLENVVIPEGVKYIENYVFRNCTNLKEVIFPKEVKEFIGSPFDKNVNLQTVINHSPTKCPLTWSGSGLTWKVNGKTSKSVSHATAVASRNKYKITYKTNGGKLSKKVASYTYGKSINLPTATKKGYVFVGWRSTKISIYPAKKMPVSISGDCTLMAVWEKISIKNTKTKSISMTITPNTYSMVKRGNAYTYVVEYATKKDFSDAKVITLPMETNQKPKGDIKNVTAKYSAKKTTMTISKLSKEKTYYVRVSYLDKEDFDRDNYPDGTKDNFFSSDAFYTKAIKIVK